MDNVRNDRSATLLLTPTGTCGLASHSHDSRFHLGHAVSIHRLVCLRFNFSVKRLTHPKGTGFSRMSNSSCISNSTSINELISKAIRDGLNITSTVVNCPQVCSLAWGNGNPDLSGIGANISYIFQAVLSILCGPLLCVIYEHRDRWSFNKRTQKRLAALHDTFLDISAQFSISVVIAAVIRVRQRAPFYELAFLRPLTTMQFLSLLSTSVTVGLFEDPFRRGIQRIFIITLYGFLEFGFYMGLIGSLIANNSSWATMTELSTACKNYGQIFPWIKHIPPPGKLNLPKISAKDYFNPFSKKGWKFSLIIFGLIMAGIAGLILAGVILYFGVPLLFKVLRGRKVRILVIPMSMAFTIGMLVELVEMERTRNTMKEITGPDFQDNQWGFGQVIALGLWVPLCIQILYYAACKVFCFSFVTSALIIPSRYCIFKDQKPA